jgi:excinuclease ABC subunit B
VRKIMDIMEGARADAESERSRGRGRSAAAARRVAEEAADYRVMSPEQIGATIKKLETQMYKHAQDLEFEEAARVRDQIHRIREQGLIG